MSKQINDSTSIFGKALGYAERCLINDLLELGYFKDEVVENLLSLGIIEEVEEDREPEIKLDELRKEEDK